MKKLFLTLSLALTLSIPALPAMAASFLIDPAPQITAPGEVVSIVVPFNPGNDTVYTVQLEIAYPNHILEGNSFILNEASGKNMRILAVDPYTAIDQSRGVMRYTIGFPGGLQEAVVLGTANFLVTAEGSGTISISPSSTAFDQNNNNVAEPFLLTKLVQSGNSGVSPSGGSAQSPSGSGTTGTALTTITPFSGGAVQSPTSIFGTGGGGAAVATAATTDESTTTATTTSDALEGSLEASVAEAVEGSSTNAVLLGILIVLVIASIASALFGLFKRT